MCCRKCDILSNETRAADCVVRVGGDEFVLIFVRVTDPVFLHRIAQRIIAKLDEPVSLPYPHLTLPTNAIEYHSVSVFST